MGEAAQGWLIVRNGDTVIGLFQGMFEKEHADLQPGLDREAKRSSRSPTSASCNGA